MAKVNIQKPKAGDSIVSMNQKLFEDYQARPGDKALIAMHTVPYEGSVGLINMLTCTRLVRKGFDTTLMLYGPGVLMAASSRGYPNVGDEAFPGHLAFNKQIQVIMDEGGKVLACRFALAALYGHREEDVMDGVTLIDPLDVLDCTIEHQRAGALMLATWTV
ncbi:MAG: MSMEG_0572 family nitrogen starvation response protein [Deltaproteobacteria bacterium]|nr:MSMEG_0572 family nitrogen starvation response protein [Deltaproteobacteria bacterium]